jgi:hypothetical protein
MDQRGSRQRRADRFKNAKAGMTRAVCCAQNSIKMLYNNWMIKTIRVALLPHRAKFQKSALAELIE